jgi:hypothetical protein
MKCRVMALKWGVPEIGAPPTALSYVKLWQIFFLSFHSFFPGILVDTLWVSQGKKEKRWGILTLFQPLAFQNALLFVEDRFCLIMCPTARLKKMLPVCYDVAICRDCC